MLRWLALGAAVGAAAMLVLEMSGMSGPWQGIALVLVLLGAFATAAVIYGARRREQELDEADALARQHESERAELQAQLELHTQLESQLRHAKQAAESAVLAKGEFLATMSHEIRTPLNGIVPMLDLLIHAPLAAEHAELVRTAYTSSQQMLRIVDDILDYSKLEAAKLELEITSFNLRELLEGVIQMMERPAQSKGLRVHLQIDPGVRLPVRGDPVRLRQVLGNLLSNAVKFTERGSVSVTVRRLGESSAQHQLRFEVRDTGIGIAQAAQSRLFQAFSQADASTTRLYGGTGLGLAISKRIVELMDGHIGVDSVPGQGTTFWFELPLLKVHGDLPSQERMADGKRLLLLSADPRLRLRLSMLLPNWGLRVTSVETTQEALNRLRTAASQGAPWAYSLVLADLAGMRNTALALYRNLNRQAVYGELELIALYGDDVVPDEMQAGATLLSRQAPDADLRAALLGRGNPSLRESMDVDAGTSGTQALPMSATAVASSTPAPAAPGPADAPLRTPRVLLVEDNPVNLMVGQRLLAMLGITCDTAGNGEAALMRMGTSRYDVVLMDCQMPVMDGYEATRRWREVETAEGDGRHLPIIAMTANAMAGDRQRCLDAGMDDYLPKPVTRSELERCLYHWWNPNQPEPAMDPGAGLGEFVAMGAEDDADGTGTAEAEHSAAAVAPQGPPVVTIEAIPAPVEEPRVIALVERPAATVERPAPPLATAGVEWMAAGAGEAASSGTAMTSQPAAPGGTPDEPAVVAQPSPAATLLRPTAAAPAAPVSAATAPAPPDDATPIPAGSAHLAPATPAPTGATTVTGAGAGAGAGALAATNEASPMPAVDKTTPQAPASGPAPATTPAPAAMSASPMAPAPAPSPAVTPPQTPTPTAPVAPTDLPPVIDEEVLEELRTMLGDEVDHLIDVFLEDTPRLIARLEAAVDGPDYDALRDTAHSLKSSSANLGAMLLSASARRIEAGARTGTLERPAVAVAMVANEFARARARLRAGRATTA
ncbi:hybrid sensor histidine kinase/response regulator [Luteimonas yindakuii]|uniref:hybrid sensor histidine kinase/response regulator n=1 Tax=Luteimonas yindakuii TaxID=2565782 RepID=UPI001FB58ADA|nr:hybrid sensor histidine kinase/response regulator [Luteimonas yindakuii]